MMARAPGIADLRRGCAGRGASPRGLDRLIRARIRPLSTRAPTSRRRRGGLAAGSKFDAASIEAPTYRQKLPINRGSNDAPIREDRSLPCDNRGDAGTNVRAVQAQL
jgi:hypothetical protein